MDDIDTRDGPGLRTDAERAAGTADKPGYGPDDLAARPRKQEVYEDPDPELDQDGHPVNHPVPPSQEELDHPEPIGWW